MRYHELDEHDSYALAVLSVADLRRVRAVAKALYKEQRLNGDEMRDLAHLLTSVIEGAAVLDDEDNQEEDR